MFRLERKRSRVSIELSQVTKRNNAILSSVSRAALMTAACVATVIFIGVDSPFARGGGGGGGGAASPIYA